MAQSLRDIMTPNPTTVESSAPIVEAAEKMRSENIGDVIVVDGGQIKGIVTDRDITVRAVAERKDPTSSSVSEIFSSDPSTLTPDAEPGEAVRLMTEMNIRRLPIVENGKPVGIVSLGDLAVHLDSDSGLADISAARPNN